jgi:hypothetical protein
MVVVVPLLTLLAGPVSAQTVSPQQRADIKQLLEVTGAAALGRQMAEILIPPLLQTLRKMDPNVPDRAVAAIREVLNEEMSKMLTGPGSIEDDMISLYAKQFTPQDVKEMLKFYTSPVGRKATASLPVLAQGGGALGQKWWEANSQRVFGTLQQRLRAEGLLK